MRDSISNLLGEKLENKILVQGIVDLFGINENEIILIDYKYSNSNSDEYLIGKYTNQLKLYKNALENAFNKKVSKIYLLSLKNARLIKVENI